MLRPSFLAPVIFNFCAFLCAQTDDVRIQRPSTTDARGGVADGLIVRKESHPQSGLKTLRVDVNLVLVPVTVTNLRNQPITDLEKPNFQLYENGHLQEIRYFSIEDSPISIGLLLDVSRSMRNKIEMVKAAVREFFDNANPQDEYFAVTFANRPKLLANPTQSIGTLEARFDELKPDGNTALLDAVSMGISKLRSATYRRRALLIISDGGDNHSRYRLDEIKSLVQESDVIVYAIGIFDAFNLPILKGLDEKMRKRCLDEITEANGGHTLIVDNLARVPEAAATISREMRAQYVLGYQPSNLVHDGTWRKIRVRVATVNLQSPLQALYKRGYAPSKSQ